MMKNHKDWSLGKLLTEYMAAWVFFRKNCSFEELTWSLQIEIKRITSVLNAFTGGNYDVTSPEGKRKIIEAFEGGFDINNLCTNEQLEQLKELFHHTKDIFPEFETDRPYIREFYRYLFALFRASYEYVTAFNDLFDEECSDEFFVVEAFKLSQINRQINEKAKIIYKAIKILLGEKYSKIFTTEDLIKNYGYPDVEYEKLIEFNKRWCRIHGIKFINDGTRKYIKRKI